MDQLPMHDALKPLAWLEGTWRTEYVGQGKYPTIKPFTYHEEIVFASIGQPIFNYVAQSWHPEKKRPMHRETGFLKVIPGTNKVSLLLAHNFGLTTIEEGEIGDNEIMLKSSSITRLTIGCKDPAVVKTSRKLKLIGEKLHQTVYMATTTTTEETEHLQAVYTKQTAIV